MGKLLWVNSVICIFIFVIRKVFYRVGFLILFFRFRLEYVFNSDSLILE